MRLSLPDQAHLKTINRMLPCCRSRSSSRNLVVHARFAKYTGDTGSPGQSASGASGPSGSNSAPTSKSASKTSSQSKASSQSITPPPPRFQKYTGDAATSGASGSKSEATSKSANKAPSQSKATSQSTAPPPKRFAKYTGEAASSGQSGATGSKTGASSKSSARFDDKQVQVQVYKPSGETSTEGAVRNVMCESRKCVCLLDWWSDSFRSSAVKLSYVKGLCYACSPQSEGCCQGTVKANKGH